MALKVRDRNKTSSDERTSFSESTYKLDLASVPKRRSKAQLTSELIDTYCRVLNQNTLEGAAQAIGFSPRTISDWVTKGQDPECTDQILIELAEKQAAVMTGGTRKRLFEVGLEHSLDDPKMAMFLMERMMPGMNPPKTQKIDMAVSAAKPPSDAEYADFSDEEIATMAHLERLKLKRLQGG